MRPCFLSSRLTSATVAFSGTVIVTSSSGFVSASTSSASRQPTTARMTDAASTQHTYKSTLSPAASRGFSGSSGASSVCSLSRLRSAYSSGSFGSKGSGAGSALWEGSSPSSSVTSPASGTGASGVSALSSSCASGRRDVPIMRSTRAISALVDAISSSMDMDEKSSMLSSKLSNFFSSWSDIGSSPFTCRNRRSRPRSLWLFLRRAGLPEAQGRTQLPPRRPCR